MFEAEHEHFHDPRLLRRSLLVSPPQADKLGRPPRQVIEHHLHVERMPLSLDDLERQSGVGLGGGEVPGARVTGRKGSLQGAYTKEWMSSGAVVWVRGVIGLLVAQ